jgi:hypothetical protein
LLGIRTLANIDLHDFQSANQARPILGNLGTGKGAQPGSFLGAMLLQVVARKCTISCTTVSTIPRQPLILIKSKGLLADPGYSAFERHRRNEEDVSNDHPRGRLVGFPGFPRNL